MIVKVAIASDHAGFAMKKELIDFLSSAGYEITDYGTYSEESVDYPDYAAKVAEAVTEGTAERGILICGTGLGMSIAANRYKGVRAALCLYPEMARMTRKHNDANVLVLSGRLIGVELARRIVEVFFETGFEGGRHERRIRKIDDLPDLRRRSD
ncbi:MAG: ribose 5-phosphate isomerase [Kosmotoga sp.]|nr:ribose 5-phosphate isomerase B [Kosmotoga olearia]MDK2952649.1 ribose 5-phosphate isomerase [Kosmotoga sp.]